MDEAEKQGGRSMVLCLLTSASAIHSFGISLRSSIQLEQNHVFEQFRIYLAPSEIVTPFLAPDLILSIVDY